LVIIPPVAASVVVGTVLVVLELLWSAEAAVVDTSVVVLGVVVAMPVVGGVGFVVAATVVAVVRSDGAVFAAVRFVTSVVVGVGVGVVVRADLGVMAVMTVVDVKVSAKRVLARNAFPRVIVGLGEAISGVGVVVVTATVVDRVGNGGTVGTSRFLSHIRSVVEVGGAT
jgi:hypothetical protein